MIVRAVFVEILCVFLAAFSASLVPLYADEVYNALFQKLQPHPKQIRPEATLLTLHQIGRYLAQILPSERGTTEICADIRNGQYHPFAMLRLVGNVILGKRGQHL